MTDAYPLQWPGAIRLGAISATSPRAVMQMARSLDAFARFDGFACWAEMVAFWRDDRGRDDGPVVAGWHIRWLPLREAVRG